jgi:hypothetical protein
MAGHALDGGRKPDLGRVCLTTIAQSSTREFFSPVWTVEAVVNFLDTPHFGQAWQTIVGRNGHNVSQSDASLPLFALKLAPDARFWMQAWLAPSNSSIPSSLTPQLITRVSTHIAVPGTWYHLVVVSNGESLRLFVNGQLEAAAPFPGTLPAMGRSARSSHVEGRLIETHGDLTFGCGMHRGELADTCSCLVSEARATEDALKPAEWLWSPNQRLGSETV